MANGVGDVGEGDPERWAISFSERSGTSPWRPVRDGGPAVRIPIVDGLAATPLLAVQAIGSFGSAWVALARTHGCRIGLGCGERPSVAGRKADGVLRSVRSPDPPMANALPGRRRPARWGTCRAVCANTHRPSPANRNPAWRIPVGIRPATRSCTREEQLFTVGFPCATQFQRSARSCARRRRVAGAPPEARFSRRRRPRPPAPCGRAEGRTATRRCSDPHRRPPSPAVRRTCRKRASGRFTTELNPAMRG